MQASVTARFRTQPINILTATAADPEMSKRPQRHFNLVGLDQHDHERPRPITEPDDRAASVGVNAAMDYLHCRVLAVKANAGVWIARQQRNMSKANILL